MLYYTLFYHDDDASDTHVSSDEEKYVSKRMGIEGASEILQESGCVMGEKSGVMKRSGGKENIVARKHAQVMGEGSEELKGCVVGEGSEGVGE